MILHGNLNRARWDRLDRLEKQVLQAGPAVQEQLEKQDQLEEQERLVRLVRLEEQVAQAEREQ